jgi:hypothetical protein
VDEEAHPLAEYVRLTFPDKVTHVAWALTANNATLIIPSRSSRATLIDMSGARWEVRPEGGIYKLIVGGADCNDPNTVGGCLIGGDPWMLVEEGVQNPLTEAAPKSRVELGGALPTPPPTPTLTPTPIPPTETPTLTPVPPTQAATQPPAQTAAPQDTSASPVETQPPTEAVAAVPAAPPTATPSAEELAAAVRPRGFQAILPYVLMGLGILVIGGGAWVFLSGRKPAPAEPLAEEPLPDEPAPEPAEEEPKPRKRRRRRKKSPPEDELPPEIPAFDDSAAGSWPVPDEGQPGDPDGDQLQ